MPANPCRLKAISGVVAFVLASAVGVATPLPARADSISGSVAYDKLNLTTADAALRTFLTAYRQGDFVTAYWIFAPSTQAAWFDHLMTFRLGSLLKNFKFGDAALNNELFPRTADMDQTDNSFVFAAAMAGAGRRGMLPVDIDGLPADLSQQNVPVLGAKTQTTAGDVDFAVALKNYSGPVVFRMRLAKSGRWRLLQIIPPGGDEKSIPFGLTEGSSLPEK